MNERHKLFIDFDGTITANDVGYELFRKFTNGATEPDVQLYRAGKINSLECLSRECVTWNSANPSNAKVYAHLEQEPLTPGFAELLAFLAEQDMTPTILSEGFDFYIDHVLATHNFSHIEKICNHADYIENILTPDFPYFESGCRECSNCKGYHIGRLRPLKSSAIFIGDGHSDLHASKTADIVFARSHLKNLLNDLGTRFEEYRDFHDIISKLKIIIGRGIFAQSRRLDICCLDHRHTGNLKELWECGDVMRHVGYPNGLGMGEDYYISIVDSLNNKEDAMHFALEDKQGNFIGEATIEFPDKDGFCSHDLKLLPEFQGQGFGSEVWNVLIDRTLVRWPKARFIVTPSIENKNAISMYEKLGFEFDSEPLIWYPPTNKSSAIPVKYRRMIK